MHRKASIRILIVALAGTLAYVAVSASHAQRAPVAPSGQLPYGLAQPSTPGSGEPPVSRLGALPPPPASRPQRPPPPPRNEHRPPPPARHEHAWHDGHWQWRNGAYVWTAGRWMVARPGRRWIPAQWAYSPTGWIYIDGQWVS